MHALSEWLSGHAQILNMLQMLLDLCLILTVLLLLSRRRQDTPLPDHQELTDSLERIITETKQIAAQFDTNLQERKLLIQQIVSKLDDQVEEARRVAQQLESMRAESRSRITAEPKKRGSDQHEILRLARQGLDAESIATRLKKPVGEVELILNLQRLSDR
jgi:hypothetical protein